MNKDKKLIVLPFTDGFKVAAQKSIIRIEAKRAYCLFILDNGENILVSKSMKEAEEWLNPATFFRSHHSHVVNGYHIRSYHKNDGGHLTMSNGDIVPLAKGKKEALIQMLHQL